jgi:hypothetical protein
MREAQEKLSPGSGAERAATPGGAGEGSRAARVLALQRAAGNRATTRMLQRWDPGPVPTGDEYLGGPDPNAPMEVTAVDDRVDPGAWWFIPRYTGPMAAATRTGEIAMTSVSSMVAGVLTEIGDGTPSARQISRLNILDHGNTTFIEVGDDRLSNATVAAFASELGRLRGKFSSGGYVHLQHCEAGGNRTLMTTLAGVFGVPVVAGTGLHNPVLRANYGSYVKAYPDGRYETYNLGPFWNEGH